MNTLNEFYKNKLINKLSINIEKFIMIPIHQIIIIWQKDNYLLKHIN